MFRPLNGQVQKRICDKVMLSSELMVRRMRRSIQCVQRMLKWELVAMARCGRKVGAGTMHRDLGPLGAPTSVAITYARSGMGEHQASGDLLGLGIRETRAIFDCTGYVWRVPSCLLQLVL